MVALVPAVLFSIWLLISRIFDIWPFTGMTATAAPKGKAKAKPGELSRRQRDTEAQFRYKRR